MADQTAGTPKAKPARTARRRIDRSQKKKEVPTTGHSWDGIEELDNPMPRWWLWTFYACIVWGLGYTVFYPAWPMITGATTGVIGWSSRGDVVRDIEAVELANAEISERLATVELASISEDAALNQYATNVGAAVYRTWCSQCHGSGAAGAVGYPNLLDDDWLWGGTLDDIHYTITHGIRNEVSLDSHYSEMPAFEEILSDEEIDQVVNYVMSLSGDPQNVQAASAGEELFLNNCSACHGEEGMGDVFVGAPNLTDVIWLYGGDYDALIETVRYSRFGVMPPWAEEVGGRLSEAEVRAVAVYVHGLGGGVDQPESGG